MSSIGKVFIIINLVLAAAFLGWAAKLLGTSRDRVEASDKTIAERQASIEELTRKNSDLQARLASETTAKDAARNEADNNKQESERNRRELDETKTENSKLQGEITKISQSLDNFNATAKSAMDSKDKAAADAMEAMRARDEAVAARDEAEMARRNAEDALRQANDRIAALEVDLTGSKKSIDDLNTTLSSVVAMTGVDISSVQAQPQIDAAVLAFDGKLGLLSLNKGTDAGVKPGMTFEVYRGDKYKGQARVQTVLPNMSSAILVRTVAGQSVAQGDSASTRL